MILTAHLSAKLRKVLHYNPLRDKLKKDNSWTDRQFGMVDWQGYWSAYLSLSRPRQISITILSHKLWNTNIQNSKFYGDPSFCPLCKICCKTWEHVYQCTLEVAKEFSVDALSTFERGLTLITPSPLLDTLVGIFHNGLRSPLYITDDGITRAITNQQELGGGSFARGHLCTLWREAYKSISPIPQCGNYCHYDGWDMSLLPSGTMVKVYGTIGMPSSTVSMLLLRLLWLWVMMA